MRFRPGQTVVRRAVHVDGRLAAVQAARVVGDDERGLLLLIERGAAKMHRTTLDGTPTRPLPLTTELELVTMLAPTVSGRRTLILTPPGAAHSIWWGWTDGGAFAGWYVNLESPARRWPGGIDVRDRTLDVRVAPDRTWEWKDEEDFAAQTGDPRFWDAAGAARIRAEGERVLAAVEAGAFPFDGTWCDLGTGGEPAELPPWWDAPSGTAAHLTYDVVPTASR